MAVVKLPKDAPRFGRNDNFGDFPLFSVIGAFIFPIYSEMVPDFGAVHWLESET